MSMPCHVLSVVAALGFGGDENRLVSMVKSMDRRKFKFSVVLLPQIENYDQLSGSMLPILEDAGIKVYQLRHPEAPAWLPHLGRAFVKLVKNTLAIARLVREGGVDMIDARLEGGMLVGIPASVITRKPSISTLYSAIPCVKYPLWRIFQFINLNLTTAVITDSTVRQIELQRWIWYRSRTTWNIPNGIPIPQADRTAAEMRQELKIPNSGKVVAQIAGIVPYKGQIVLLEAARKVIDEHPDVFFLIVGYCRGAQDFKRRVIDKIRELKLEDRVRICAYPGPIGDIWQIVDIHVHASLFDSLPNAILEGMALGKPALVTSVGGIREAVENEKTGLVVAPNDPDAIAKGLLRLLRNPDEARSFGAAAQARFEARYQSERMAKALETCFRAVLHSRN